MLDLILTPKCKPKKIDDFSYDYLKQSNHLSEFISDLDKQLARINLDVYSKLEVDNTFVKQDGSTPFKNPQSGVDAISEDQLTTLRQLNKVSNKIDQIEIKIDNIKDNNWIDLI